MAGNLLYVSFARQLDLPTSSTPLVASFMARRIALGTTLT